MDVVFQLRQQLVFGHEVAFFDEQANDSIGGASDDSDFLLGFQRAGGGQNSLNGAEGNFRHFHKDGGRFAVVGLFRRGKPLGATRPKAGAQRKNCDEKPFSAEKISGRVFPLDDEFVWR